VVDAKGNTHRIDAPDEVVEIPLATVPDLPGPIGGAAVPPNGFDLTAVPGTGPAHSRSALPGGTAVPALPSVPGAGDLPGGTPAGDAAGGAGSAGAARKRSLLRLSLGELTQRTSARSVTADAATIRLDVLTLTGGPLLSIRIGELHAAATAPTDGVPSSGAPASPGTGAPAEPAGPDPASTGGDPAGGSGSPNTGRANAPEELPQPGTGAASGGSLPVTGTSLGLVLAAGVALVLLGRLAVLLARRAR
jgi:hypothetical protein